ncbi:unnamed protein product [Phytomonas sp. Hart1]|nr:unnamed protein product [Phytomonas sp. Hart1]|eukprot:CCW69820.1 unnamed protein product [Phytomonas sp. isolate Hart1]
MDNEISGDMFLIWISYERRRGVNAFPYRTFLYPKIIPIEGSLGILLKKHSNCFLFPTVVLMITLVLF